MPRPRKSRKICNPPKMSGFKPFGLALCKLESVRITFEEYESIKLINYESLSQEQAADLMKVSRPTFTRIYNKALKTISIALIEGKALVIEGGDYELESEWFKCKKCFKLIEGIENHIKCESCTQFGPDELILLNQIDNGSQ